MAIDLRISGGDVATHTAGNAPGVNDGAAAVIVASQEWASSHDREPIARILSYGAVADDFPYLARTPAGAAKQALRADPNVKLVAMCDAFMDRLDASLHELSNIKDIAGKIAVTPDTKFDGFDGYKKLLEQVDVVLL